MDESGKDEGECSRKVASGRRVAGAVRPLVDARSLHIECAKVLHESLLAPVLTYGSETMIWREMERSRIWAVQINNLRGLMGIRRMDKFQNTLIMQLSEVMKGVELKIGEGVLRWFSHVERMENDRIAKRIYVGEYVGSRSVGRPRKRLIDTVKHYLKKIGVDVRQGRRIVHDRSVWRAFVRVVNS